MRQIDADALLAAYDEQHEGEPGKARKLIEDAPTICNSGHWIIYGEPPMYVKQCSLCGSRLFYHAIETLTPYCACCGGRMEGTANAVD